MSNEEARALAYRVQANARAIFQAHLHVLRFGSRAAYIALFNRTKAIGGVKEIEVNEWEIDDEEFDEQKP